MGSVEEQIRLSIPADPQYVRLVRLLAASVADRIGFDYDQVGDLRVAVDELSQALLAERPPAGVVTITCIVGDDMLSIIGTAEWPSDGGEPPTISGLSRRLLETVVDEYEYGERDGRRAFRLVKRRFAQ